LFLFPTPYSTRYFQGTLDHHFPFRSESTKMDTAKRFPRDGRPPAKNTFGEMREMRDGRVRRADLRLLKHTSPTATRDSGSYEIEFPDGRPSAYVYWDDNPGRRSITLSLSSEEAEQIAKELARTEQDKLKAAN
jgi:hypothetical protein